MQCGRVQQFTVRGQRGADFFEDLQFLVEFSKPGHTGKLVVVANVNGVLSGKENTPQ